MIARNIIDCNSANTVLSTCQRDGFFQHWEPLQIKYQTESSDSDRSHSYVLNEQPCDISTAPYYIWCFVPFLSIYLYGKQFTWRYNTIKLWYLFHESWYLSEPTPWPIIPLNLPRWLSDISVPICKGNLHLDSVLTVNRKQMHCSQSKFVSHSHQNMYTPLGMFQTKGMLIDRCQGHEMMTHTHTCTQCLAAHKMSKSWWRQHYEGESFVISMLDDRGSIQRHSGGI